MMGRVREKFENVFYRSVGPVAGRRREKLIGTLECKRSRRVGFDIEKAKEMDPRSGPLRIDVETCG